MNNHSGTSLLELTINKARGLVKKIKDAGKQISSMIAIEYCPKYENREGKCASNGNDCINPSDFEHCSEYINCQSKIKNLPNSKSNQYQDSQTR